MRNLSCIMIISICIIFGISARAQESKSVQMLFFNVAPHVFIDKNTGNPTGAVYEFINNYLAPEMGVEFLWQNTLTNIPRQIDLLEKQSGYAGALVIYSPKRVGVIDYTKTAYFISKSTLMINKTNPLKEITEVGDILHMKIGYANNSFITSFMRNEKINFVLVSHTNFNEGNIKKLLSNRLDAAYAPDKASLLFIAQDLKVIQKVKTLDPPENPALFHIVFSKGSKELVNKYNKAFDKLDGQKLYLKILNKYIDTSLM